MKNRFDLEFDPPAAIGTVVLRDIETGKRSVEIRVILDTGSDVTLLPKRIVDESRSLVSTAPAIELEAFDGTSRQYESVTAQVVFLGKRISGVYFLVDESIGILGRDVLNHYALLFDGPALEWVRIDSDVELGDPS